MADERHKIFISYHHANDQKYKEALLDLNRRFNLFVDCSVDTGDIDETQDDDAIRRKIRDEYLRDSTVTILLVGTETKFRKHVDWEIYSSMYDGAVNKKSGLLVMTLPTTLCSYYNVGHGDEEKRLVYPETTSWVSITNRSDYELRYPHLPDRIIDNLLKNGARISVANWGAVTADITKLRFLIEATFRDRGACDYDLSRPMRRANSTAAR
jgi:hypothetical protein